MIATLLLMAGCGTADEAISRRAEPEPIGLAECSVCGMVVGEQPAPRGQVAYRDGSHAHVCSIEELRAIVQNPSSKGRPVGMFVEALPVGVEPTSTSNAELPWRSVHDVWFVFGTARPGVMGEPVLVFAERSTANLHATKLGTQEVSWTALEQTPFNRTPVEAGVHSTPSPE